MINDHVSPWWWLVVMSSNVFSELVKVMDFLGIFLVGNLRSTGGDRLTTQARKKLAVRARSRI